MGTIAKAKKAAGTGRDDRWHQLVDAREDLHAARRQIVLGVTRFDSEVDPELRAAIETVRVMIDRALAQVNEQYSLEYPRKSAG